jgi:hypothetical protein
VRRHLAVGLGLSWALAGLVLALVGLLMVADQLSLREVLAATGFDLALQVVLSLHLVIEHPGAQAVELGSALLGAAITTLSVRRLRRMRA